MKYLNRYTELRELPGGKIGSSEGFDLYVLFSLFEVREMGTDEEERGEGRHPDLANDQRENNGFHNYLDEFR